MLGDDNTPHITNAASKPQQREAGRKIRDAAQGEDEDLLALLAMVQGRRFLWRMLKHCRVTESIWHPSALIHYNSGVQDVGHFILAEIVRVRPESYLQMMQEAQERAKHG